MSVISASASIPIGEGAIATEVADLTVLPLAAPGEGKGRLIHPTLGTFDYYYKPDEWTELYGDLIAPPKIATSAALLGSVTTVWPGDIRDLQPEERWTTGVASKIDQFAMFVAMWTTPPGPTVEPVQWWPSYQTNLGYKVLILDVSVAGKGLTFDFLTRKDFLRGEVIIKFQILGRVDED